MGQEQQATLDTLMKALLELLAVVRFTCIGTTCWIGSSFCEWTTIV